MKYDRLGFVKFRRGGEGGKTERTGYDFSINEQALSKIIEPGDSISPFGWQGVEAEKQHFEQLLLRTDSGLKTGRVRIYICPECAALDCGSITIKVTKYDDCFVWSEFGFENLDDDELEQPYEHIGDYSFQKTEYYRALNRFGFE